MELFVNLVSAPHVDTESHEAVWVQAVRMKVIASK